MEGIVPDHPAQNIMGRLQDDALDVPALLDRHMAERWRGPDGHASGIQSGAEFRIGAQLRDDGNGGFSVNGTGVVGEDFFAFKGLIAVLQADHIAPVAGAAGLHRHAASGSLQGAAACKVPAGITAEDRQNGRIAAGRHGARYRPDTAQPRFGRQGVNGRFFRRLQRRSAAQFRHGIIRHAVSNYQNVFHRISAF